MQRGRKRGGTQVSQVTCIFTAPTCIAAIIPLEPCALNAEFHTEI
jgi:hypothetical protein